MTTLQPNQNMENYLTVKEAAFELKNRISRSTLYRMMDEGTLPKYKLGGRVFLHKNDVSSLLRRA